HHHRGDGGNDPARRHSWGHPRHSARRRAARDHVPLRLEKARRLTSMPQSLAPRIGSGFGGAVSRILSAPCGGENHLSERPIPETCGAFTPRGAGRSSVSYLALHPMGFSVPRRCLFAGAALPALFPPSPRLAPRAVCFSVALSVGQSSNWPPACISI